MPQNYTRIETVLLYSFKELVQIDNRELVLPAEQMPDRKAVDRAREWLQEGATDFSWWEYLIDMWKQALEQIGFTDPDIRFSGFCSQGDGASFTAGVDVESLLDFIVTPRPPEESIGGLNGDGKEEFRPWLLHKLGYTDYAGEARYKRLLLISGHMSGKVTRTSHHYVHYNTCTLELDYDSSRICDKVESLVRDFEETAESLREDLCHVIYKMLEEEHDWLTGDEALAELAEDNEWLFDRRGKMRREEEFDDAGTRKKTKPAVRPSLLQKLHGTRKLLRE